MGKFVSSIVKFYEFCEENEVKFIDFRFSDIKGAWHHITYNIDAVDADMLDSGIPFDGSSIDAWQPINESDMMLKPEVTTAFLDPFTADPTIIVICDVFDLYKNELYEKCPRSIAKKTLAYLQDSVNTGHRPRTKGGYFPVAPTDSMVDLRAEMMQVLEEVGLEVIMGHHEVGQAQGEIGVKYATLIEAADNVQKFKYVVKMVAHLNGKTATFMPKPLMGDNGTGMHTHQSIWKDLLLRMHQLTLIKD